jgi:hypothetical protein
VNSLNTLPFLKYTTEYFVYRSFPQVIAHQLKYYLINGILVIYCAIPVHIARFIIFKLFLSTNNRCAFVTILKLASLSTVVIILVYMLSYINEAEILRSFVSDSAMCDEESVIWIRLPVQDLYYIYDYLTTCQNIQYDKHLFIFCIRCEGQDVFSMKMYL